MDGPRLIITFADGARIEVANFGAIDPIPNVILEDGTILAGGVVVAQLGAVEQALDFEDVGAGPELPGGGVSAYSDDHGTVIGMLTPEGTLPLTAFGPRPPRPSRSRMRKSSQPRRTHRSPPMRLESWSRTNSRAVPCWIRPV